MKEFQNRLDEARKRRMEERRKERILERKVQHRIEKEERERKEREEKERRGKIWQIFIHGCYSTCFNRVRLILKAYCCMLLSQMFPCF